MHSDEKISQRQAKYAAVIVSGKLLLQVNTYSTYKGQIESSPYYDLEELKADFLRGEGEILSQTKEKMVMKLGYLKVELISEQAHEINELKARVDEQEKKLSEQERKLGEQERKLNEQSDRLSELERRLSEQQCRINDQQGNFNVYQSRLNQQDNRIRQNQCSIQVQNVRLNNLQDRLQNQEGVIIVQQERLAVQESKLEGQQTKLVTYQNRINLLQNWEEVDLNSEDPFEVDCIYIVTFCGGPTSCISTHTFCYRLAFFLEFSTQFCTVSNTSKSTFNMGSRTTPVTKMKKRKV